MSRGRLRFIHSPMFAGKTANMLLAAKHAKTCGKVVLLMKPQADTRCKVDVIKSRCGMEMCCDLSVGSEFDFVKDVCYEGVDIVFVDEAQFLSSWQIESLREAVDVHGISVWCYGLLTDFKKCLFDGSKRLVELSDELSEIQVLCGMCKENARFHLRYVDGKPSTSGPTIDIEMPGCEKYASVCHACWKRRMEPVMNGGYETPNFEVVAIDIQQK
ncbi:thymidine kinase [Ordospora pajunii]|uniref:thymidine kinase n=1 Tax=Ordospora pajunii TaxID=3039483 RepID=UPI002952923A|nr:thymidine kinase [Ordospora pajunii]KAH9412167.1 thymidine kinase [Ordospora pajunii]